MIEKYIVYSISFHEKGLRPAEEVRDGMRKNVKPYFPAENVIWQKMDDNHNKSITNTLLRMLQENIERSWRNFVVRIVRTSIQ